MAEIKKTYWSFGSYDIKKALPYGRDFGNFVACPIVDTETVPITVYSMPDFYEKNKGNREESIARNFHSVSMQKHINALLQSIQSTE